MNPGDGGNDHDPNELAAWQRALYALEAPQRAMVLRMARMLCAAAEAPAPRRRARLAPVNDPDAANDGATDDLSRAMARRILARHGRGTGGVA